MEWQVGRSPFSWVHDIRRPTRTRDPKKLSPSSTGLEPPWTDLGSDGFEGGTWGRISWNPRVETLELTPR